MDKPAEGIRLKCSNAGSVSPALSANLNLKFPIIMQTNDNKNPLPEPLAYNLEQAAAALNMSTKSVRRLLRRRILTRCKALRKILIPRKQIEDFLRANCDEPKPAS